MCMSGVCVDGFSLSPIFLTLCRLASTTGSELRKSQISILIFWEKGSLILQPGLQCKRDGSHPHWCVATEGCGSYWDKH